MTLGLATSELGLGLQWRGQDPLRNPKSAVRSQDPQSNGVRWLQTLDDLEPYARGGVDDANTFRLDKAKSIRLAAETEGPRIELVSTAGVNDWRRSCPRCAPSRSASSVGSSRRRSESLTTKHHGGAYRQQPAHPVNEAYLGSRKLTFAGFSAQLTNRFDQKEDPQSPGMAIGQPAARGHAREAGPA